MSVEVRMFLRRLRLAAVLSAISILLVAVPSASAQTQTVGLFVNDERASDGYTLLETRKYTTVYLIDNGGLVVNQWETGVPRSMVYLLPNGDIVRAVQRGAGFGLRLQQLDWDGNLVWDFSMDDSVYNQHHDIEPLPNGNVLVLVRESKTPAEAIAAGRDPLRITGSDVKTEAVLEIHPIPPDDGEIVWEWHLWDHLVQDFDVTKPDYGVIAEHPERFDINYGPTGPGWIHGNSVFHDAEFDHVFLSSRYWSELWVIDHSTTSEEAAGSSGGNSGKGGDLLYRWGNPEAYGRGTLADQRLFEPHDAQRIPVGLPGEGNILVFNNGFSRPEGTYSSAEELVPPLDEFGVYTIGPVEPFEPEGPVWTYVGDPPESFYSQGISGLDRRPEGTTLICEGRSGHLFEVTPAGEIVWDYVNPVGSTGVVAQGETAPEDNDVFKVRKYSPDYPAFVGRDLTPGDPVELFNAPFPVPQGSLRADRLAADQVQVAWDASTCTSHDYRLLHGPLDQVSTYGLSGAECDLGTTGTHVWTGVPAESLFFLVVGTDDIGVYESSWGRDSEGDERHGTTASMRCGATTKIVSSTCP
jgi:hypothetical protein